MQKKVFEERSHEHPMYAASSELLLENQNTMQNAAEIVTETCNFMLARFDMMKQSLWDEDSSTCFYSEKML